MRILLNGNAPWCPSGYAEQIALLAPRLRAMGHEVGISANYGLQGAIMNWDGIPVYPSKGKADLTIPIYAEHFQADIVISLQDAWTLHPKIWPEDFRMAVWAPVDHHPIPPMGLAVLRDTKVQPIAMSKDGAGWMQGMKLEPLYAPHAVDTRLFCPMPNFRDEIRDEMGIPRDAFLIGMVAANKGWNTQVSRKAFPQIFEAFSRFSLRHDDAWLFAHTDAVGGETNLDTMVQVLNSLSERPGHLLSRLRFPSEKEILTGLPRHLLAAQFSAFDVLVNCSMGEGFGVPIIESQACGVPVIVSRHSAMTELVGPGWLVEGDPWYDSLQTSMAFMPHIGSIEAAFEAAYEARGDQAIKDAAREFALDYDADHVAATYWAPIIEQLAALGEPREIPPLNGKAAAYYSKVPTKA